LPLAGLLALASQAVQVFLDLQPYPAATSVPDGFTSGFVQNIDFVGSHTLLFNSEYTLLCLAVLAFLPAVIALFAGLRSTDVGFSVTGTALAMVGVVLVLFASIDAFTDIQEAALWDSGCTACGIFPLQASFGTSTLPKATQIGDLLIVVGILILSAMMLRSAVFSKVSGVLGIVAALYALVGGFAFSSLSETNSDIASAVTFVLLTIWGISITPGLLRLAKADAPLSGSSV